MAQTLISSTLSGKIVYSDSAGMRAWQHGDMGQPRQSDIIGKPAPTGQQAHGAVFTNTIICAFLSVLKDTLQHVNSTQLQPSQTLH